MSHIIPPILSTTPPPLNDIPDDDDDFGDFAVADDPFHTECEAGKDITWIDESLKKNTDNTSQDSVLSSNTDSGLCSDSSPLPGGENNNCDHHPVNCDVPLSESIPRAQCDSIEKSTKGENENIPFSASVNLADGDSKLGSQPVAPDILSEFRKEEHMSPTDNGFYSNFDEHCVKEEENNSEPPEKGILSDGEVLEAEATLEVNEPILDWDKNRSQAVNGSEDLTSDHFQEIKVCTTDSNLSQISTEDHETSKTRAENEDFGEFESNFVERQNEEAAEAEKPEMKLDGEGQLQMTDETEPAETLNAAQTLCSDQTEQQPSISQDFDFDYECSAKDDETTESFGFLDESPESQFSEELFKEAPPECSETANEQPEFDDFGDFAEASEFQAGEGESVKLEFDAFKDSIEMSSDDNWALPEENVKTAAVLDDDEDDDFGDFEEADEKFERIKSTSPTVDKNNEFACKSNDLYSQPEKIKEVVASIFDCNSPLGSPEALSPLSIHLKHLWPEVQDVQNTPALEFQWNNSKSHDQMLSSLGIDTRNILFGHQWNSSMPRFAANLGHSPLEPVKAADILSTSNSMAPEQENVPAAQFDWSGSGLVNPLDCDSKVCRKILSAAAQKVISHLPDLSFMRATSLSRP
ncbi:Hypothetical predicted protein [Cloeon dipterum]|uniref:Aftiphilin clathrin-binding box domain-containing protein n=2 Tax=Cloeon dipterum TaxID=197152 RepID=A0A8S1C3X4_9INSE|nr:Hypothetical predicted protein [Cloeon dipterum]